MPQSCPLFPKAPGSRLKPSSAQKSLFIFFLGVGEECLPFHATVPPTPEGSVFLCWGKVLMPEGLSGGNGRAAVAFMRVLISPVAGEKECGQGHCLPALRAPLFPPLGWQGSGRQGCPPASAASAPPGSGFQGSAREAVQSKGSWKRKGQLVHWPEDGLADSRLLPGSGPPGLLGCLYLLRSQEEKGQRLARS